MPQLIRFSDGPYRQLHKGHHDGGVDETTDNDPRHIKAGRDSVGKQINLALVNHAA